MSSLSEFRRAHIGRALFRARSVFEAQFDVRIRQAGFADFRTADVDIIARLPLEGGARITEIAATLPISKQAVAKSVESLVQRGYVAREPDPHDGRAQRIVFAERGRSFLATAQVVIPEIEAEWEDRLGREEFAALKRGLLAIADALGSKDPL